MAKSRKLRTEGFLSSKPLPTPEEVNKVISEVTGQKEIEVPETPKPAAITKKAEKIVKKVSAPVVVEVQTKRVPLTTAITPENRAKLEVSSINGKSSVADLLNAALEHYFENIAPVADKDLVKTFTSIYARKAK